jgi:hypothetical protein
VATPGEAAEAALRLLDTGARQAAVARARNALEPRLGVIDGAATARAARLVRELIAGHAADAT